ncbi:MAG: glycoside hydrolase family 130 protein [Tepidisphaeraceae bacterium]
MNNTNDLARRFPENPLLRPADIQPSRPDWQVECLLNPGVFRFNGKTCLLVRVAERPPQREGCVSFPILSESGEARVLEFDRNDPRLDISNPRVLRYDGVHYLTTLSHLRMLTSDDGIRFREDPAYPPLCGHGAFETFGIEDSRVSRQAGVFYLTYTAVSPNGVAVGMRSTSDWKQFHEHGLIFPPHNKDCALFEEKIGGRYFALHRPSSPEIGGNYIWLAQSPDRLHWGRHACLARTRPGMWDSARVGAGAAPIRNPAGWLEIYHGANERNRYCLGAMLLDLEQPWKVIARSKDPIMEPSAPYEQTGFFGNVIFTNGHLVDDDMVTIYYGASDSVICGAQFSIAEILTSLVCS